MKKQEYNRFVKDILANKIEPADTWEQSYTRYTDVLYFYPANDLDADFSYCLSVTWARDLRIDEEYFVESAVISNGRGSEYELMDYELEDLRDKINI